MTEIARPGDVDLPEGSVSVMVADLARQVVDLVAPEQLEYFGLVTESWESGKVPRRPRSWTGGTVGSGVDPSVLADIVYPLLAGTIAQVLGATTFAGLQRRRWWRRKRRAVPSTRITLTSEQVDQARTACIAHGMTLGLNESEATMLADAVHGALRRSADGGGS
ncbi:hypothetical protein FHS29_007296 [Saccharothrix tamanrassetensis]|uniref:Uncharacterized protein n=1 Tax=Saccharothrix tamanrassetensis TaxID=1051531 RepID=A0A841CX11_9PSEU|nr:hypothetical protein [Saccharothrix tamanrassetensis]MBB5960668.1 hypothetical protein [Saccharothrix tamanrassetensis]